MLYAVQKNIDHMHRIRSDAFIFSNIGKILLHKRKFSKLRLVHDLELHVEPILKKIRDFACSVQIYIFVNELHCKQ
jgi:hypothetical protein